MAIVENTIKEAIKSMMETIATTDLEQEEAIDFVAGEWATVIADAIKSATIAGITTTGSASAQQQVPGTGTLS